MSLRGDPKHNQWIAEAIPRVFADFPIMDDRNSPAVYFLSNEHNTVIYIGVTHTLRPRIQQHKEKQIPGFTKKYNVDKLVYYEFHADIRDAIAREKQLKAGSRKKKIELIESVNPEWKDLYNEII